MTTSSLPLSFPTPIRRGMPVIDANDQVIGEVVLTRTQHFVMRQDLVCEQLVAVPALAVAGVLDDSVFLTLTPGQIELVCERREVEQRERVA